MMNPFDVLTLIPDDIKNRARDELVKFVTEQAKKHLGDEIANKLKKLRSDAAFNRQFEAGLEHAVKRFIAEYEERDEDLVAAIVADQDFFKNEQIQHALLEMIKKPDTYLLDEQETIRISFESVMSERKNRQRVDLAVTYLLKCLAEELWHLPELLPIYSLQFQRITAEATHRQVEIQEAHLQATLQIGADIRQALAQLTEAMQKNLLAAPALVQRPKPYHNLPRPDYSRFVGRQEELAWLRQRLSPQDRAWQIAITGIGGVGKSALALAIAHEYREKYDQLEPEERFDAIIWISAKEEVLTAQGREQASLPEDILRSLEDIYAAIAGTLDRQAITIASPADQGKVVRKALSEQRTLLVLDNLESIKDERIKPFLRNLPSPTKVIITSRVWLDVADIKPLMGMGFSDAQALILAETSERQIDLGISQHKRIYELTSGLPLPIKLAIARLSSGESFQSVERWIGDASGDLPEYCIRGQVELIRQRNPFAWKMLQACSLFDRNSSASFDALAYVVDLSMVDCEQCLLELGKLSLINPIKDHEDKDERKNKPEKKRFGILPITQRYVNGQFSDNTPDNPLLDRWIQWLSKFAQEMGEDFRFRDEPPYDFELEHLNIVKGIRWCLEHKKWALLYDLVMHSWTYFYMAGNYQLMLETSAAAEQAADILADEQKIGWVKVWFAKLARWRNEGRYNEKAGKEFIEAISQAVEAAEIGCAYHNSDLQGEALEVHSHILQLQAKYDEAEELSNTLLEIGRDYNRLLSSYHGSVRLCSIAIEKKNFEHADILVENAKNYANQMKSKRYQTGADYYKAQVLMGFRRYEEAEKILQDNIAFCDYVKDYRRLANNSYLIATLYRATNNTGLAAWYAHRALDIYTRIGMDKLAEEVQEFISKLSNP